MKKIFLFTVLFLSIVTIAAAQQFGSIAGQEAAFNAKYKLTASIDEKTMTLKWSTNASITKAVLSVYTKEQLAVRKGTDHTYPFNTPVNSYQFNLNAPAYKGFYAYWLKVYTGDGLWQEYFFRRKETGAGPADETGNLEGYTIFKTTINCEAGKKKITDALKGMDGVFDIKIDINTGKLALKYSTDGTPYTTIIQTILNNGFDADDEKTTKASANPCQGKTGIVRPIQVDPNFNKKDPSVLALREKLKVVKPLPGLNLDNATAGGSFTLTCSKKTYKTCSLSFSNAASVDNTKAIFTSANGAAFIHLDASSNGIEEGFYVFEVTISIEKGNSLLILNWPTTNKESITANVSGQQKITFMQEVKAGKSAVKLTTLSGSWKFLSCQVTKLNF